MVLQHQHPDAADGSADRRYLLEHVHAGPVILDHPANAAHLPVDPIEPGDEFSVILAA
jgi:hypothetical protein